MKQLIFSEYILNVLLFAIIEKSLMLTKDALIWLKI